jgi:hypothetical protein
LGSVSRTYADVRVGLILEQSRAYSSASPEERRWSCLDWKNLKEGSGCFFPGCFFCPEAEFWKSVWMGRYPTRAGTLGKGTRPSCPCKQVTRSLAPVPWSQVLFSVVCCQSRSSPLCSVSGGCREPGGAPLDFLPLCLPRPELGYFCTGLWWEEGIGF